MNQLNYIESWDGGEQIEFKLRYLKLFKYSPDFKCIKGILTNCKSINITKLYSSP